MIGWHILDKSHFLQFSEIFMVSRKRRYAGKLHDPAPADIDNLILALPDA